MISGSLCGQMIAHQNINEMQKINKKKAQGVLDFASISLNVPNVEQVKVDQSLLNINIQSMLDDLQIQKIPQDLIKMIQKTNKDCKKKYVDLIKQYSHNDYDDEALQSKNDEPEENKFNKKKSLINEHQRTQLNNNPYHQMKRESQQQPQVQEEKFNIDKLIPEFIKQTQATDQEARFFLNAVQQLEPAIQLFKETKQ